MVWGSEIMSRFGAREKRRNQPSGGKRFVDNDSWEWFVSEQSGGPERLFVLECLYIIGALKRNSNVSCFGTSKGRLLQHAAGRDLHGKISVLFPFFFGHAAFQHLVFRDVVIKIGIGKDRLVEMGKVRHIPRVVPGLSKVLPGGQTQ